ncbi:MAG: ATP-dependent DNA helicase, partial [Gemmataceae bacterium]
REGKGALCPLGVVADARLVGLSAEQRALVEHVLRSTDRVVLVVGDAGSGKTHAIQAAFAGIDRPVAMLAPSADASRGVLRAAGFADADTVASFLLSPARQQAAQGGVLWVDEAGLLPIRDLSRLAAVAQAQGARLVLQGDPKQHRSPSRHGDMMNVLREYASLPVGRLREIRRQHHEGYKQAVAAIAAGKGTEGFDRLDALGWVRRVEGHAELAGDYLEALRTKRPGQADRDRVLVVAPTHAEGEALTAEIRRRLKEAGRLGEQDVAFERLVPLHWTQAERGDAERYTGEETLVFHRNSGTFRAGDRVRVKDWKRGDRFASPAHFSVYRTETMPLAAGDAVRVTANGKTLDGHRVNNGATYKVEGFDAQGNVVLDNGRTLPKTFGHLAHGYAVTSHAAQGRTADRVLIAAGGASLPAVSAEGFYVAASRGRESATLYSDLDPAELREAIRRADPRTSATALLGPEPAPERAGRLRAFLKKTRSRFVRLRTAEVGATRERTFEEERTRGGRER